MELEKGTLCRYFITQTVESPSLHPNLISDMSWSLIIHCNNKYIRQVFYLLITCEQ